MPEESFIPHLSENVLHFRSREGILDSLNILYSPQVQSSATQEQILREGIIANALSNVGAKSALARAMVDPIRINLNYQSIGRSLLQLDPIEGPETGPIDFINPDNEAYNARPCTVMPHIDGRFDFI